MTKQIRIALGLAAIAYAMTLEVRAGDPGELFPNVTYDQAVDTPRLAPKTDTVVPPPPPPKPAPVIPPATPAPKPPATPTPNSPASADPKPPVADKPKPETPDAPAKAASTAPARREAYFWAPYKADLLLPLIAPEQKAKFDEQFGAVITSARSTEDKKPLIAALGAAAAPDKSMDDELRRYMLLQALSIAIQIRDPLATHEALIKQVQPLLENDHTLPATEARANLLDVAAQGGAPLAKLLDLIVDAYDDLAIAQVQAGYPVQAEDSVRKARQWISRIARPAPDRSAQVYYAAYWVSRGEAALTAPRLKANLAARPADPATNTQIATLQLSLFGDLASAARSAPKSDRAALVAFGKLVGPLDLPTIGPQSATGVTTSLDICEKLLDVAADCTESFDRYAIATYALTHLEDLSKDGKLDAGDRTSERLLQRRAQAMVNRNGPTLPRELMQQLLRESMTSGTDPANPDAPVVPTLPTIRRRGRKGG